MFHFQAINIGLVWENLHANFYLAFAHVCNYLATFHIVCTTMVSLAIVHQVILAILVLPVVLVHLPPQHLIVKTCQKSPWSTSIPALLRRKKAKNWTMWSFQHWQLKCQIKIEGPSFNRIYFLLHAMIVKNEMCNKLILFRRISINKLWKLCEKEAFYMTIAKSTQSNNFWNIPRNSVKLKWVYVVKSGNASDVLVTL